MKASEGIMEKAEEIMSTVRPTPGTHGRPVLRTDDAFLAEPVHEETRRHIAYRYTLAVTRLSLGWVFLWAFLDKLFGLGHETASKAAWINGGSPTEGFLANAPTGPFESFYKDIAGQTWADWLFMIGLAGIGIALILGVTMRIAAAAGVVLLVMMWSAVLPPENNPFMDDHLIYAMVLVLLAITAAGRTLGLGRMWERIPFVARHGVLK
jgi:thiosulfate dehydrogenase [quinone] large subunit